MLEVRNIKKQYGTFQLEMNLKLEPGCVTAIIGQNGAGKSTLFKSILGIIEVDEGEILFNHQPMSHESKNDIGVVIIDSGFSEFFVINDIIDILKALYKDFDADYFKQECQQFSLPLNKKIKDFSTGMKAKLKLLIALCHETKMLLLDEPTNGLDVLVREDVLSKLRDYMTEDKSILISSHISSDLENFCDDFYLIHEGKILLYDTSVHLQANYAIMKVYEEDLENIDQQYIIAYKKESYGYALLTHQRQFYMDNYPHLTIEKVSMDTLMNMMIRGERR